MSYQLYKAKIVKQKW